MNVIVVGGGKVGRKLVEDFNDEGDDVVLIDIKSKICDRIQDDYDVRAYEGAVLTLKLCARRRLTRQTYLLPLRKMTNLTHFAPLWLKNSVRTDVLQE